MKQIIMDVSPFFVRTALVEQGRLIELAVDVPGKESLVGNIYAAKIVDIVKKQFAFVNIGEQKNAFLQLDDFRQRGLDSGSQGSRVLVQVLRDATSDKGPMLSSELSFPGRLLVLTKGSDGESFVKVSNKITSSEQRERLKSFCEGLCPEGFNIIVRTVAENADPQDLAHEIERLSAEAEGIIRRGKLAPMPTLLYGSEKIYSRALKGFLDAGAESILLNDSNELDYIQTLALNYANVNEVNIFSKLHSDGASTQAIFDLYDIESQVSRALRQKIWLKSGAYLLIEETDTCTYIDINTGKFPGKKNLQDTTHFVNIEAAVEIASQIRLRNISGLIIVDFVGNNPDDSDELADAFKASLAKDRTPAIVTDWSELNIVQLTRKHTRPSLRSMLMESCRACAGSGYVFSAAFFADKIYKEIIKIYSGGFCDKIVVSAHEDIVRVLETMPSATKNLKVHAVQNAPFGFYEISAK